MAGTATIPGADVASCALTVNGQRINVTVAGEVTYQVSGRRNEDMEDAQTTDPKVLSKHTGAWAEFGALVTDRLLDALSGAAGVTMELVALNGHTLTGTGGVHVGDPIQPNLSTGQTNSVRFRFRSLVDANRNT